MTLTLSWTNVPVLPIATSGHRTNSAMDTALSFFVSAVSGIPESRTEVPDLHSECDRTFGAKPQRQARPRLRFQQKPAANEEHDTAEPCSESYSEEPSKESSMTLTSYVEH